MTPHTRRRFAVAAILMTVLLAAAVWRGRGYLEVGVAYKAKMLCSGVFVAHRSPTVVLDELQRDDLAALRYIDASIDSTAQTASAAALWVRRRASLRPGLGCVLHPPGGLPVAAIAPVPASIEDTGDSPPIADALRASLGDAFSEVAGGPPRRTLAVVVLRRGMVLAERYAPEITVATPLPGWSMAKSVTGALVGALVGEGRLRTAASGLLPEWAGDGRHSITLDHLLRMSSGLRLDEAAADPGSDVLRMLFRTPDASGFAAARPLEFEPGTHWEYTSASTNIVARVMRRAVGDDTAYWALPRRALFDRIGMSSAVLEADASGTFVGSSFMYATARDWARFGELYLNDGVWDGERVLPAGWVAYSRSPSPADPSRRYGAHLWLRVPDEYCASGDRLPEDAFHAAGHEGQFVTVVPSRDMVIVRLGRSRDASAWDHCAFVSGVLAAGGGGQS